MGAHNLPPKSKASSIEPHPESWTNGTKIRGAGQRGGFHKYSEAFLFQRSGGSQRARSGFRLGEPIGALFQVFERLGGGCVWDTRRQEALTIINPQVSDLNTFGLLDGKEMDHRQDVRESRTTRFSRAGARGHLRVAHGTRRHHLRTLFDLRSSRKFKLQSCADTPLYGNMSDCYGELTERPKVLAC